MWRLCHSKRHNLQISIKKIAKNLIKRRFEWPNGLIIGKWIHFISGHKLFWANKKRDCKVH